MKGEPGSRRGPSRRALDPDLLSRDMRKAVRDEVEFHLEMRTREFVESGVSMEEARRRAEAAFGSRGWTESETGRYARRARRRRTREAAVEAWTLDVKHAVRALRRRPGFSATVAVTLALGIGGTTAMFAVVHGVLLEPLPYPEPDRLVRLWETTPQRPFRDLAPANFVDARNAVSGFRNLTAYRAVARNLVGSGEPERLAVASASANFFETLGVPAVLGRTFSSTPVAPGEARGVVLSQGLWARRFGSDPGLVGRTLRLDDEVVTVLGVMAPSFDFPSGVDLWIQAPRDVPPTGPLTPAGEDHTLERASWYFAGIARLAQGVSLERAQSELDALAARIRDVDPEHNAETGFRLVSLHADSVRDARATLWMLFGAVGFVLLIACANVANLTLGRSHERRGELAVRSALGAGRARLLRHLLAENGVLGLLGGAAGIGLALLLLAGLRALPSLPGTATVALDAMVVLFALTLTALATLVSAVVPAMALASGGPGLSTRDRGESPAGAHVRQSLVAAEVGLAVVLVLGAALTLQSLWHMSRVDLGLDTPDLTVLRFSLPGARSMEVAEWHGAYSRALENIRTVPGVEAAGLSSSDPLAPGWRAGLRVLGQEFDSNDPLDAGWAAITPGYLEAVGSGIVAGRGFDGRDVAGALPAAIVNETFASQAFGDEDPLGKQINTGLDGPGHYVTVVGVMRDVRNRGPALPVHPAYIRPLAQPAAFGGDRVTLAVRSSLEPEELVPAVQQAVWQIEPDAPFYRIERGDELRRAYGADVRFVVSVLGAFALVALTLGAVGIYGVAANSARRRTREIGIRMALGAGRRQASGLIMSETLILALVGTGLGTVAALALTRLLSGVLFGVRASDPLTYAAVVSVLVVVALLAAWSPARRAAGTDPLAVLRES